MWVVMSLGCATGRPAVSPSQSARPPVVIATPTQRAQWLDMFARGYFIGRSGQLFLVPREGDFIIDRDPLYRYMHGSPWSYDTAIPLLLTGAPFIRPGVYSDPALQQDIAPTVGALIGAPSAPTYTGRILAGALAPSANRRPRVVVVFVLDAMRADYFDRYADRMPTLARLRREGAWFNNARANTLPTLTSVGHANVGTGTDPRFHGITVNNLFNRVTKRAQPSYLELDPGELMALTLADLWNLTTDGQAIIIGQGGAIRATAGLVGRGGCLVNGHKVIAASYTTRDGGWETNSTCYTMSPALATLNARTLWEQAGGTWRGHDIANPARFRASALFQRFEGDATVAVLDREPIGADTITDLVFINMKGPDYVAHAYGPDSPELQDTLGELDQQVARILAVVDRKAGAGQSVVVMTADHGMPAEPPTGGRRFQLDEITGAIHERFDPGSNALVTYNGDSANNQIYLDTARLRSLGHSLSDVARLLEERFFAAVFTENEVRTAQSRLPRP